MKLQRNVVRVLRGNAPHPANAPSLSPAERMDFAWELTKEAYSLSGANDVESRLQRNVVKLIRKKS